MNRFPTLYCRNEVRFDHLLPEIYIAEILLKVRETPENLLRRKQHGDRLAQLSPFDFLSLIPYTEEINEILHDMTVMNDDQLKEKHQDSRTSLMRYCDSWRSRHWGTISNARNALWIPELRTFIFDTISRPATPIVSELHYCFPDAHIQFEYYERAAGFIGGCEFIPEKDWTPGDYTEKEVHSLEERSLSLLPNTPRAWMRGTPYNSWSTIYMGFKGG